MLGLVSDACAITGAVTYGVALEDPKTARVMVPLGVDADILGGVAAAAHTGMGAANWLAEFVANLDKALMSGGLEQDEQTQILINKNDPSADQEIIMPGQPGDTLASSVNGSAFQYSEDNSKGIHTSSMLLALNGDAGSEIVSGGVLYRNR